MSQLRILIVENEEVWQDDIKEAIQSFWDSTAEVDVIDSPQFALSLLDEKTYDLVIVDLSLSGPAGQQDSDQEGLELLRQIRQHRRNQYCVIVVHTAHDKASVMRQAQRILGADDYLVKAADKDDFDNEQFVTSLKTALFEARLKRVSDRTNAYQRVTFRFDERNLLGSERTGTGGEFANPLDPPSQHRFGDLLRRANNLYLLLASGAPQTWREEARSIGEAVYQILGEHRLLKPLDSARLLAAQTGMNQPWLQFSGPAMGLGFPFELLHDGNDYLCLRYPFTRRNESVESSAETFHHFLDRLRKGKRDLRVLVVGANSDGTIPAAESEARLVGQMIKTEAERLGLGCYVNRLIGEHATYDAVRHEIETGVYDIFHYAGHGRYDDQSPDHSGLILKDTPAPLSSSLSRRIGLGGWRAKELAPTRLLTASALADMVKGKLLQLIYLSSCHGARTAAHLGDGNFRGTLEALSRANVPVVLGYRWAVRDNSAEEMASVFYQQLWRIFSPGEALLHARRHIAIELGRHEETWASPVLLAQSP